MHTTACVEKLSQFCLGQTSYLKPKGKAGLTNKREEIVDGSKKSGGKKKLSNNRYQEKGKKKRHQESLPRSFRISVKVACTKEEIRNKDATYVKKRNRKHYRIKQQRITENVDFLKHLDGELHNVMCTY